MITFEEALSLIAQKTGDIRFPKQPARLYAPIAYLLALKGKKLRPALTLLACSLYKDDVRISINMALAWEIFHNFTLMHDDVMDKADLRRGEPAVHKKWNENTAILSGDAMLIMAYKYLAKYPISCLKELLDLFSTTATEICEGQEYDMQFENRLDIREEEYLNMIRLKTAVLLGACLKSGAVLGGAEAKDQDLLYDFGINLGIAFQIQDDILDVYGDAAVFGKKIGGDILCNKKTYLLVSALNSNNEEARAELLSWLQVNDQPEQKIEAVTKLYNRQLLREKARNQMDSYYKSAIRSLNEVDATSEKKTVLMEIAKELMNREA
ncbi:MAG: 6E-farnesyl diphosphate synthase [Candidatus Ordinivivax streblomastigis]|uniref:6E-farnesyl diphosphate synthase n=1 Tax=Candidatus Ordinivivax streblomastigis TaxID=2540710 RepID=A0A5M8NWN8_9BACT|nr:MAG: 6E-farnesyl diphosphate synthase [Candidatus Ordinivivax streblomastigis]